MTKIMLVDDEESIKRVVSSMIADAGYDFVYAKDGFEALSAVGVHQPDLIILDVMMPRMDGFTTCQRLRSQGVAVPVIFLSAKGDIVDKGVGFQAGGDDYMTKPFDPRELLMHIQAQLRRAHIGQVADSPKPEIVSIGRITLDSRRHQVTKNGAEISLTPKEFAILLTLASHPGDVFSKEQLVESVWGKKFVGETSSITVFMKKLRGKIEDDPTDPRIIETGWGIGYRLNPDAC